MAELARTSTEVAAMAGRNAKIARLAVCLGALAPDERATGARWLAGLTSGGRLGVGYATVSSLLDETAAAPAPSLSIVEVERALIGLAAMAGAGAGRARREALGALFTRATVDERALLAGLLTGGLRQGAVEGLVVEAIARAAGLPTAEVRAAHMRAGELGVVAAAALGEGAAGLARFTITLFRPLLPMLASPAEDLDAAMTALGHAVLEHKLDGVRLQVHREGDRTLAFTRGLHDVTALVPELVAAVRALPVERAILDGTSSSGSRYAVPANGVAITGATGG